MKPIEEREPDLNQAELIRTVGEDLNSLYFLPSHLTEAHARRLTPILRRLLVEKHFGRAWRAVGFEREPIILASDLTAQVAAVPPDQIVVAYAQPYIGIKDQPTRRVIVNNPEPDTPGVLLINSGLGGQTAYVLRVPDLDGEPRYRVAPTTKPIGPSRKRDFSLSALLESPAVIIGQTKIPRRVVIKYVANRRGGVHQGGLSQDKDALTYELLDSELMLMAPKGATPSNRSQQMDRLFVELLSIAGFVGAAESTYWFLEKCRDLGIALPKVQSS